MRDRGGDETDELARGFNTMAEQIEQMSPAMKSGNTQRMIQLIVCSDHDDMWREGGTLDEICEGVKPVRFLGRQEIFDTAGNHVSDRRGGRLGDPESGFDL